MTTQTHDIDTNTDCADDAETRSHYRFFNPNAPVAAVPGYDPHGMGALGKIGFGLMLLGLLSATAALVSSAVIQVRDPLSPLGAMLEGGLGLVQESGSQQTPFVLPIAVAATAVSVLACALGIPLHKFDRRSVARRNGDDQVLSVRDLAAAPPEFRIPMCAAHDATKRIRRSTAYMDGWLTGVDLDAALWDLAEHVKLGARLHTQLAEFDNDHPEHFTQIQESRTALRAAIDHVSFGAERLAAIAEQIGRLDEQLAEPDHRAALEAERDRQAIDNADRAVQLAETGVALANISPALDDVADTITGRLDAYAELPLDPGQSSVTGTRSR